MCGGTKVNAPAPDPNQQLLEQEQLKELQQQQDDIASFKPFVLQQYGLKDTNAATDAERASAKQDIAGLQKQLGDWQGKKNDPGYADAVSFLNNQITAKQAIATSQYDYTPEQKAKNDQLQALQDQALKIQTANNQRVQDALAGKIGPSDALTRQKNLDFQVLQKNQGDLGNEVVGDSLDNATAKTTSGQQALAALKSVYGGLQATETNNIINGAPQVSGAYQSIYMGGNPNAASTALSQTLGPLASLTPQFSSAYAPYMQNQQLRYGANSTNATNTTNMITGLMSAGIGGVSRYAGAKAGASAAA